MEEFVEFFYSNPTESELFNYLENSLPLGTDNLGLNAAHYLLQRHYLPKFTQVIQESMLCQGDLTGKTPLHFLAFKGRVKELLEVIGDRLEWFQLEDKTHRSVYQLALENSSFKKSFLLIRRVSEVTEFVSQVSKATKFREYILKKVNKGQTSIFEEKWLKELEDKVWTVEGLGYSFALDMFLNARFACLKRFAKLNWESVGKRDFENESVLTKVLKSSLSDLPRRVGLLIPKHCFLTDSRANTPLHYLMKNAQVKETAKIKVLNSFLEKTPETLKNMLRVVNFLGETVLSLSIQMCSLEVIKKVVQIHRNFFPGELNIHLTQSRGKFQPLKDTLDESLYQELKVRRDSVTSYLSKRLKVKFPVNPFEAAVDSKSVRKFLFLIQQDLNINTPTSSGGHPLNYALASGFELTEAIRTTEINFYCQNIETMNQKYQYGQFEFDNLPSNVESKSFEVLCNKFSDFVLNKYQNYNNYLYNLSTFLHKCIDSDSHQAVSSILSVYFNPQIRVHESSNLLNTFYLNTVQYCISRGKEKCFLALYSPKIVSKARKHAVQHPEYLLSYSKYYGLESLPREFLYPELNDSEEHSEISETELYDSEEHSKISENLNFLEFSIKKDALKVSKNSFLFSALTSKYPNNLILTKLLKATPDPQRTLKAAAYFVFKKADNPGFENLTKVRVLDFDTALAMLMISTELKLLSLLEHVLKSEKLWNIQLLLNQKLVKNTLAFLVKTHKHQLLSSFYKGLCNILSLKEPQEISDFLDRIKEPHSKSLLSSCCLECLKLFLKNFYPDKTLRLVLINFEKKQKKTLQENHGLFSSIKKLNICRKDILCYLCYFEDCEELFENALQGLSRFYRVDFVTEEVLIDVCKSVNLRCFEALMSLRPRLKTKVFLQSIIGLATYQDTEKNKLKQWELNNFESRVVMFKDLVEHFKTKNKLVKFFYVPEAINAVCSTMNLLCVKSFLKLVHKENRQYINYNFKSALLHNPFENSVLFIAKKSLKYQIYFADSLLVIAVRRGFMSVAEFILKHCKVDRADLVFSHILDKLNESTKVFNFSVRFIKSVSKISHSLIRLVVDSKLVSNTLHKRLMSATKNLQLIKAIITHKLEIFTQAPSGLKNFLLHHKTVYPGLSTMLQRNPLHQACREGNLSLVEDLLESNLAEEFLKSKDEHNMTPLMIAAQKGCYRIVEKINSDEETTQESLRLAMLADCSEPDFAKTVRMLKGRCTKFSVSVLKAAALTGNSDIVLQNIEDYSEHLLLDLVCCGVTGYCSKFIEKPQKKALIEFSLEGPYEFVQLLLNKLLEFELSTSDTLLLLRVLVKFEFFEFIKKLYRRNKQTPEVNLLYSEVFLYLASKAKQSNFQITNLLKTLLSLGVDPNVVCYRSELSKDCFEEVTERTKDETQSVTFQESSVVEVGTPLHWAVFHSNTQLASLLVKQIPLTATVELSKLSTFRRTLKHKQVTALELSCIKGSWEMIDLLCQKNIDLNLLELVLYSGNLDCFAKCIQTNSQLDFKSSQFLHKACKLRQESIALMILEHYSREELLNTVLAEENTILHCCSELGLSGVVAKMLKMLPSEILSKVNSEGYNCYELSVMLSKTPNMKLYLPNTNTYETYPNSILLVKHSKKLVLCRVSDSIKLRNFRVFYSMLINHPLHFTNPDKKESIVLEVIKHDFLKAAEALEVCGYKFQLKHLSKAADSGSDKVLQFLLAYFEIVPKHPSLESKYVQKLQKVYQSTSCQRDLEEFSIVQVAEFICKNNLKKSFYNLLGNFANAFDLNAIVTAVGMKNIEIAFFLVQKQLELRILDLENLISKCKDLGILHNLNILLVELVVLGVLPSSYWEFVLESYGLSSKLESRLKPRDSLYLDLCYSLGVYNSIKYLSLFYEFKVPKQTIENLNKNLYQKLRYTNSGNLCVIYQKFNVEIRIQKDLLVYLTAENNLTTACELCQLFTSSLLSSLKPKTNQAEFTSVLVYCKSKSTSSHTVKLKSKKNSNKDKLFGGLSKRFELKYSKLYPRNLELATLMQTYFSELTSSITVTPVLDLESVCESLESQFTLGYFKGPGLGIPKLLEELEALGQNLEVPKELLLNVEVLDESAFNKCLVSNNWPVLKDCFKFDLNKFKPYCELKLQSLAQKLLEELKLENLPRIHIGTQYVLHISRLLSKTLSHMKIAQAFLTSGELKVWLWTVLGTLNSEHLETLEAINVSFDHCDLSNLNCEVPKPSDCRLVLENKVLSLVLELTDYFVEPNFDLVELKVHKAFGTTKSFAESLLTPIYDFLSKELICFGNVHGITFSFDQNAFLEAFKCCLSLDTLEELTCLKSVVLNTTQNQLRKDIHYAIESYLSLLSSFRCLFYPKSYFLKEVTSQKVKPFSYYKLENLECLENTLLGLPNTDLLLKHYLSLGFSDHKSNLWKVEPRIGNFSLGLKADSDLLCIDLSETLEITLKENFVKLKDNPKVKSQFAFEFLGSTELFNLLYNFRESIQWLFSQETDLKVTFDLSKLQTEDAGAFSQFSKRTFESFSQLFNEIARIKPVEYIGELVCHFENPDDLVLGMLKDFSEIRLIFTQESFKVFSSGCVIYVELGLQNSDFKTLEGEFIGLLFERAKKKLSINCKLDLQNLNLTDLVWVCLIGHIEKYLSLVANLTEKPNYCIKYTNKSLNSQLQINNQDCLEFLLTPHTKISSLLSIINQTNHRTSSKAFKVIPYNVQSVFYSPSGEFHYKLSEPYQEVQVKVIDTNSITELPVSYLVNSEDLKVRVPCNKSVYLTIFVQQEAVFLTKVHSGETPYKELLEPNPKFEKYIVFKQDTENNAPLGSIAILSTKSYSLKVAPILKHSHHQINFEVEYLNESAFLVLVNRSCTFNLVFFVENKKSKKPFYLYKLEGCPVSQVELSHPEFIKFEPQECKIELLTNSKDLQKTIEQSFKETKKELQGFFSESENINLPDLLNINIQKETYLVGNDNCVYLAVTNNAGVISDFDLETINITANQLNIVSKEKYQPGFIKLIVNSTKAGTHSLSFNGQIKNFSLVPTNVCPENSSIKEDPYCKLNLQLDLKDKYQNQITWVDVKKTNGTCLILNSGDCIELTSAKEELESICLVTNRNLLLVKIFLRSVYDEIEVRATLKGVELKNSPVKLGFDFNERKKIFYEKVRSLPGTKGTISVSVNRRSFLKDILENFSFSYIELRKKLNVTWKNEQGIDCGGLSREFFDKLSREIIDPKNKLFEIVNERHFKPSSNSKNFQVYQVIGAYIANALIHGFLVEINFAPSVYKKIYGKELNYKDLKKDDPVLFNSLNSLLQYDEKVLEELDFRFETQDSFGNTVELVPNGSKIKVSSENVNNYVEKMAFWHLYGKIAMQFEAFYSSFLELVTPKLLGILKPQDIEFLLNGNSMVDLEIVKERTQYIDYTSESQVIKWLWNWLENSDETTKKAFIRFATGSGKIPYKGIDWNLIIGKHAMNNLPRASTCFNSIYVPEYRTYEDLNKYLTVGILEGSEGFGFA